MRAGLGFEVHCNSTRRLNQNSRRIHYSEKIFDLSEKVLQGVSDRRPLPRISTRLMLQSVLGLYWARLGSLHALEMVRRAPLQVDESRGPLLGIEKAQKKCFGRLVR